MTSVLTGEAARCGVIGFPSVSWYLVVRVAHKRYHRLCTLQAQGRMHVQMKVRDARANREEASTGGAADEFLRQIPGGMA
jgi:hypothetical protein